MVIKRIEEEETKNFIFDNAVQNLLHLHIPNIYHPFFVWYIQTRELNFHPFLSAVYEVIF